MSELGARAWLERLVGFDTISHRSNRTLIDFVAADLARQGVATRIIASTDGAKANLFATIGPDVAGGIVLSGHSDVVPVAGQAWTGDPFVLREERGRLYGRGACDMKGFIAVALALVPHFRALPLKRPIHLALSHDEEVGCLGAPAMIALLGRELPKPALAIIGEPTGMRVINASKGIRARMTTIVGRDGHSSAPDRGANAIAFMARFIAQLEAMADRQRALAPAIAGLDFDPPWTTFGLGTIEGGTAINIIARTCRLGWEFRAPPGVDADAIDRAIDDVVARELRPALLARAPEGSIETHALCAVPALRPEPDGLAETLALRLTGANRAFTAAYAAEAGQFQEAGLSAVIIGPGEIEQAHKPDEFVTLDQLAQCESFLRKLAAWACD